MSLTVNIRFSAPTRDRSDTRPGVLTKSHTAISRTRMSQSTALSFNEATPIATLTPSSPSSDNG
ncbi:hypothetical protein BMW22_12175 [Rhizobium leguminosarum]|uniref:Uncharacterized protein n=1 Tax=Rhizobium leguminosarum TaxID=384 RepID=A0A1L3Z9I2_RHILE|nr:hypothetical protein BMW22_12175 [Rhizobium leguminosarum]